MDQEIKPIKSENSPYVQLLLLGVYALGGLLIVMLIGFVVALAIYGNSLLKDTDWLLGNDASGVGALKILLTAQQIGLFLVPALLLAITEGKRPNHFYGLKMPKLQLLGLVFLLMLFATPIMGLTNELNQKMVFPEFLKGVETWMRRMEDEGTKTTMLILKMKTLGGLFINLLVIAIVPAICEEFIFRGGLQRTLLRMIRNPHVAIWLSAIIFSSIHFQFFGFFPRLFLGAAFGYLYYWTGSLWYAIFAHFLNNAYAVLVAFYLQAKNLPINSKDGTPTDWYAYIISAILTIALFKIIKHKAVNKGQ